MSVGALEGDPRSGQQAMRAWLSADPLLSELVERLRAQDEGDSAHGLSHILRVTLWTLRLLPDATDPRAAAAAALLHDCVPVPKDSPLRNQASRLSAARAREWLGAAFDEPTLALICDAIADHSFSYGATPRSPLGDALQDADRLEALGILGWMRCVATGVRMNAAFFDDADPWAETRPLDDRAFSVDHWFVKLRRLAATMRTEAGRAEAQRRHDRLRRVLEDLGEELGAPMPSSDER
jgi:uncharacterized protein